MGLKAAAPTQNTSAHFSVIHGWDFYKRGLIWCKIPFLHENTIFIKIFFIRFVNISQFWDFTMITYFVTDSRYDSPTWQSES